MDWYDPPNLTALLAINMCDIHQKDWSHNTVVTNVTVTTKPSFDMLPKPATPARKSATGKSLRVPRDAAIRMLRNNLCALAALLIFHWFFPIYPGFKKALLPKPWLEPFNTMGMFVTCPVLSRAWRLMCCNRAKRPHARVWRQHPSGSSLDPLSACAFPAPAHAVQASPGRHACASTRQGPSHIIRTPPLRAPEPSS